MFFELYGSDVLSEGTNQDTIVALEESWITGEDPNELSMISNEMLKEQRELEEGAMLAEGVALVCSLQENADQAEALNEAAVKDYFDKFVTALKKAWARVKQYFLNLGKSIAAQLLPVKKAFNGIEKYLDKDFSGFSYTAYEYEESDIAEKIDMNILGIIGQYEADIKDIDGKEKIEAGYENKQALINSIYGELVTGNMDTELTPEQAILKIKESYGKTGSKTTVKGPEKATLLYFVKFVREFDKNGTIKKLQEGSNKAFKQVIADGEAAKKKIASTSNKENKEVVSSATTAIKKALSSMNTAISAYNRLMGVCISLEKEKFSTYRAIVSAAVKYNPKKVKEA